MNGLGLRTFDVLSFEHTFEQLITGRIHLRRSTPVVIHPVMRNPTIF